MGVASVLKTTLIVPRSSLPNIARDLADFEWFHPLESDATSLDPNIEMLASRARKIFTELDDLVRALEIQMEPGLLESLARGYSIGKEEFQARNWEELITKLENQAVPLLESFREKLEQIEKLTKSLAEERRLLETLNLISSFSVNIEILTKLKRTHVVFSIVPTKDVKEIARSLLDQIVIDAPVGKTYSALLVIAPRTDAEKVDKILRSFEVKPLTIPTKAPQNPSDAYKIIAVSVSENESQLAKFQAGIEEESNRRKSEILALREGAQSSLVVLEKLRKPKGTKRLAVIEGYVPEEKSQEFKNRHSLLLHYMETPSYHTHHGRPTDAAPTLFKNHWLIKAFEAITLNQGPPRYGELDPTPIITLLFPIFYGMMFADFGQGLVLLFMGLVIIKRAPPSVRQWGTLIAAGGVSASIVGLLIGEFFGLKISQLPFAHDFKPLLHVELTGEEVLPAITQLLSISILLGILHIAIGLTLDVANAVRLRERIELITEKIPTLVMYFSGILFGLAFIGNGNSFVGLSASSVPLPLLATFAPLTVGAAISISLPIITASVLMIILGKPVATALGKLHGESIPMALVLGVIEFLLRVVEFLANTISYARLGILLLVHAALMFAVNLSWALGPAGFPIVVIGNIGVMVLEGMIVYIQDLRLHLYEWFTKFYQGTGSVFRKILPETTYFKVRWKRD